MPLPKCKATFKECLFWMNLMFYPLGIIYASWIRIVATAYPTILPKIEIWDGWRNCSLTSTWRNCSLLPYLVGYDFGHIIWMVNSSGWFFGLLPSPRTFDFKGCGRHLEWIIEFKLRYMSDPPLRYHSFFEDLSSLIIMHVQNKPIILDRPKDLILDLSMNK